MPDGPHIRIATHDGAFHADEVLAVSILTTLFPNSHIMRSRDPFIHDLADFVVDVGGVYDPDTHRYDHHMKDPPKDEHGHTYSSAGLIWLHCGRSYLKKIGIPRDYSFKNRLIDLQYEVERIINTRWIYPIDRCDNGVATGLTPISEVISSLGPTDTEKSREAFDIQFQEAVKVVSYLLKRACFHAADYAMVKLKTQRSEKTLLSNNRILIIDTDIRQFGNYSVTPTHFLIYSGFDFSEEKEYYIIRPIYETESKNYKTSFPPALFGMNRDALEAQGVKGISFIHHSGYKAKADSRQEAIDFCLSILEPSEAN